MIENFKSNNSKVEFYSLDEKKIFKTITEEQVQINKTDNIYFTYWLDNNSKTRKSDDYVEKRWFMLDLDIRKNFELEFWEKISDDDIIEEANNIIKNLNKELKEFSDFSYIVFSWNWLQIHYLWDWQYYTPEEYLIWVKEIYKIWDSFWWSKIYEADPACANISRVMRMPWTINQKNGAEAKVIYSNFQISKIANKISYYANKRIWEENQIKQEQEEKIKQKFSNSENNFYEEINKIPSYIIAQYLIPQFNLNKNWKNFNNEVWWFTWYFYNKETNTICNWWSRHFNWWEVSSCYNNFALVKHFHNLTNKDTFEFFKNLIKK